MNQLNSSEGNWYPQLPEGYTQQTDWNTAQHSSQNHWNPSGGYNWQSPSYPSQPSGWPGSHSHQNWPGGSMWPGQQPGTPSYPGGGGWPNTPSYPGGREPHQPPSPPSYPGGGQSQGAPQSPPPSQAPAYPEQQLMRVDPGGIRGCLYRYTYIWTSRRRGFWFYPTFVGRTSIAGYRWNSKWYRWEYTGFDLDRVDTFTCY